jgi:hypothetical protein
LYPASDPYDSKYNATALHSVADGEQYDSVVPSHPLSKVRGTLRTVEKSMAFQQQDSLSVATLPNIALEPSAPMTCARRGSARSVT